MCFTIGPKFRVISAWWGHSPGQSMHSWVYCGEGGLIETADWQRGAHREQSGREGELIEAKWRPCRAHRKGKEELAEGKGARRRGIQGAHKRGEERKESFVKVRKLDEGIVENCWQRRAHANETK